MGVVFLKRLADQRNLLRDRTVLQIVRIGLPVLGLFSEIAQALRYLKQGELTEEMVQQIYSVWKICSIQPATG